MRRREFIRLFGGAAVSWPLAVYAQQRPVPVIGFVNAASPGPLREQIAAFREGLKDSDYVEGHNVAVEYRWAEGQYDRLPALVADLVHQQVSVIVAGGGAPAVLAAKAATTTIPIVFSAGGDPVKSGLVVSLNHPSGNITGVYQFTSGLEAKRLGLLHEMVPKATPIAVLINSNFADAENQLRDVQEGFLSTCSRASGSLATLTSRTILPVLSTMQTLVSLTEMSSPAKWSMLRFSF